MGMMSDICYLSLFEIGAGSFCRGDYLWWLQIHFFRKFIRHREVDWFVHMRLKFDIYVWSFALPRQMALN